MYILSQVLVKKRVNAMIHLLDCLLQFFIRDGQNVIVGDLNCGNIDWINLNALADNVQNLLLNFATEHGYCQQGRRHSFEDGGTILRAEQAKKFFDPPLFVYLGGTGTEHCTVFITSIIAV